MAANKETIRVLLVDDHIMVRRGLVDFLEAFDDLEMIGEASNGLEALEKCAENQPDVILMDLMLPEMNGVEATRAITQQYPNTQVIALTTFYDEDLVHAALEAGALSYLQKNVSIDELVDAIRKAHAGEPVLSLEATRALINVASKTPKPGGNLTEREREVLALMVSGKSNPEIAETLTIALSTVKTHVSSVLNKLNIGSRTEAVVMAIEQDLI